MAYGVLLPMAKRGDTAAYFRNRKYVASTQLFKVDSTLFATDINLYEKLSDWDAYKTLTLQFADKYFPKNRAKLTEIAGNYLLNISDSNALLKAVQWVQQAITLGEDYKTCILSAKLYHKLNDEQNALTMVKRAKDIATQSGHPNTVVADLILASYQSNKINSMQ